MVFISGNAPLYALGHAETNSKAGVISEAYKISLTNGADCVDIDGDTIVITQPGVTTSLGQEGRVLVYIRDGETWTLQQIIVNDYFYVNRFAEVGISVSGDKFATIGYYDESSVLTNYVIFIYRRNGSIWEIEEIISPFDIDSQEPITSVALNANRVAVGCAQYGTEDGHSNSGKAFVYRYTGLAWISSNTFFPDFEDVFNGEVNNEVQFGADISIDGDYLVVGAPGQTADTPDDYWGAIYIYKYASSTSTITTLTKITNPEANTTNQYGFGTHCDISINTIVALNWAHDKVYVYERSNLIWSLKSTLTDTYSTGFGDTFAVVYDNYVAATSSLNAIINAQVFKRQAVTWAPHRFLTESQNDAGPIPVAATHPIAIDGTTVILYGNDSYSPQPTTVALYVYDIEVPDTSPVLYVAGHEIDTGSFTLFCKAQVLTDALELYTQGPVPMNSNITLYTAAPIPVNESLDLYLHGPQPSAIGLTLYTQAPVPVNDTLLLHTWGHLTDSANTTLYIQGLQAANITLNIHGHTTLNANRILYVNGHDVSTESLYLYTQGALLSNRSIFMYMCCEPAGTPNSYIDLFTLGGNFGSWFSEQEMPLFLMNDADKTKSIFLYLQNDETFVAAQRSIFLYLMAEPIPVVGSIPLYIQNDAATLALNLYIRGLGKFAGYTPSARGIPLFIARDSVGKEFTLFCKAADNVLNSYFDLYTLSTVAENSNIPLYIGGQGLLNSYVDLMVGGVYLDTASLNLVMPNIIDIVPVTLPLYTHGY